MPHPELPEKTALIQQLLPHREKWDATFRPPGLEPVGEGEESVWDYPRPPIVEPAPTMVRVGPVDDGKGGQLIIAQSDRAMEIKETAGAPVPYLPPEDVRSEWLEPNGAVTHCEWKGAGVAYDLVLPSGLRIVDAAWNYPDPFDDLTPAYSEVAGWFAFYPAKLACFALRMGHAPDGGDAAWEPVRTQPGGIYGGWVTDRIKGPVKGAPGTEHW